MRQLLAGGFFDALDTAATEYNWPDGGFIWLANEAQGSQLLPTAGKVSALRVRIFDAAGNPASPGAGSSWTFTLRRSGNPTPLTCAISEGETAGGDAAHTVSVSAWDYISLEAAPGGTPSTGRYAIWSMVFQGDDPEECVLLGPYEAYWALTATPRYNLLRQATGYHETESYRSALFPTPGTIKKLAVRSSPAPVGGSVTVRLRRGTTWTSLSDTPVVVTISGSDTQGQDLVNPVGVDAAEYVALMFSTTGSPGELSLGWSSVFVPTTEREFPLYIGGGLTAGTKEVYNYPVAYGSFNANEAYRRALAGQCTLKRLYLFHALASGRTLTVMKSGAATDLAVTLGSGQTLGSDLAHEVELVEDDYVNLRFSAGSDTNRVLCGLTGVMPALGPAGVAAVNEVAAARIDRLNTLPWGGIAKVNRVG